jgi:hypothetical protein
VPAWWRSPDPHASTSRAAAAAGLDWGAVGAQVVVGGIGLAIVGVVVGGTDEVGETDGAGDDPSAPGLEPWPQALATVPHDRTRAAQTRIGVAGVDQ